MHETNPHRFFAFIEGSRFYNFKTFNWLMYVPIYMEIIGPFKKIFKIYECILLKIGALLNVGLARMACQGQLGLLGNMAWRLVTWG